MSNNKVDTGYFCYLKKKLVYVNLVVGTMAIVTDAEQATWHKKVPVCMLRPTK